MPVIENEFVRSASIRRSVIKTDEDSRDEQRLYLLHGARDLIRVLGNLMKRRNNFDRIVIETTGMANPGR